MVGAIRVQLADGRSQVVQIGLGVAERLVHLGAAGPPFARAVGMSLGPALPVLAAEECRHDVLPFERPREAFFRD